MLIGALLQQIGMQSAGSSGSSGSHGVKGGQGVLGVLESKEDSIKSAEQEQQIPDYTYYWKHCPNPEASSDEEETESLKEYKKGHNARRRQVARSLGYDVPSSSEDEEEAAAAAADKERDRETLVSFGSTEVIEIIVAGPLRRCRRSRWEDEAWALGAEDEEDEEDTFARRGCCADTPLDSLGENWQSAGPWQPGSRKQRSQPPVPNDSDEARECQACGMWVQVPCWGQHISTKKHKRNVAQAKEANQEAVQGVLGVLESKEDSIGRPLHEVRSQHHEVHESAEDRRGFAEGAGDEEDEED